MGWGNGISIGWPNASSQGSPTPPPLYYTFLITNCPGDSYEVYSSSSVFEPGIYVYKDPELTAPFVTTFDWGVDNVFVYSIFDGLVQNNPNSCG